LNSLSSAISTRSAGERPDWLRAFAALPTKFISTWRKRPAGASAIVGEPVLAWRHALD
jgi:hypothetical protein